MRRSIATALVAGLLAATATFSVASAQQNVIQERQALMKQMGEQTQIGADMLKGKTPFDAAKAENIFKVLGENMKNFENLFPAGSDVGDNKATAVVWSDKAGFDAEVVKFRQVVADNAAAGATEAGFKAAFTAVGEGCRACHQNFKTR